MLQNFKFSRELNFLFLSVLLFAIAMGINLVTFPTILNKHGVNTKNIGLAFTLDAFGGILISFFLSKIVARLTMMRVLRLACFTYAAIILIIYFYQNFYLWGALAFLMGAMWFIYVITRQSWLNMLLRNDQRGIALGIFSMLISAGIAFGPVIVKFSGADHYLSFAISATLAALSFLCLKSLNNAPQPKLESERIALKEFFKKNPRVFLGRFFLDFQSFSLLTFSVIFGVKTGFSYEASGLLITAYMASGFFDAGVGFLFKKWNPYQLINFGFLGCLCCFLAVIFFHSYLFLISIYFIFGIFIACIFISVFKVCNDDYSQEKLVAANATFQLIGSIGAMCGSLVGGLLLNLFGSVGFPITIILCCISYLTFLVIYEKKNSK
jgi:MFS family permease